MGHAIFRPAALRRLAGRRAHHPPLVRCRGFRFAGAYTLDNSGRSILTASGTKQVDLSLFKSFARGENTSRRLQFRVEAYNPLTTPQFNNPDARIGFAAVSRVTSAGNPPIYQRTPRQIQLALKLYS